MAEDRASAKSQADDQIALYLRSTRLTTLIKLERQQSPMTVSLADVGSPTGHPVIVFLGLGCVRYLVGLYDELAEALGLRIICLDRWGLGKTTEVPDEQRGFLEWASVVEEVADQLLLDRFSILAHSAGAPYALASSLRLADRVHGSIHLLAPWVSMTAEGGINAGAYKWLKYIPNSMIKTVQAAEWKMTGWRLGKPPSLNHPPVGFDARAPVSSSHPSQLADLDEEESRTSFEDELESHRPSHPPPPPIRRASKKSGTSSEEVEQSYRSRISVESNDRRSIVTDSSMGRSKNSVRFNGSSSSSPLATNNNSLKASLFGKIFNSQSGASEPSSNHHSLKPADPSSPFDHKFSTLNRASPNTTPLPLFLNSIASPAPSYGGSCEDETDEKNGFIVNHHQETNHLPIYSNDKRTVSRISTFFFFR
jgi:pimeloyl-ACP methyl ester carboxylesterase